MVQNRKLHSLIILVLAPAFLLFSQEEPLLHAAALIKQNKPEEAIQLVSESLNQISNKEDAYFIRGKAFYLSGNLKKATEDFNQLYLIDKEKAKLWMAKTYARQGNSEKATDYLKMVLEKPNYLTIETIRKDSAFDRIQESDAWFSLWQENWGTKTQELQNDVNYYLKQGQIFKALNIVNEQIEAEPNNKKLYYIRANIHAKQNNILGAIKDFNLAEDEYRSNAKFYVKRGSTYLLNNDYEKAIEDYKKAMRLDAYNFDLWMDISKSYYLSEQYADGAKELEQYLEYFPQDQKALYLCGECYFNTENYIQALRYFNKCLLIDSANSDYYKARGKAYFKTNMVAYAIKDFAMALDINPDDAELYLNKGIAYYKLGEKEAACNNWNKAAVRGNKEALKNILDNCQ